MYPKTMILQLLILNGLFSVMHWLSTIPLHSFDKKTPTANNVTVEKVKEKVGENETTEL